MQKSFRASNSCWNIVSLLVPSALKLNIASFVSRKIKESTMFVLLHHTMKLYSHIILIMNEHKVYKLYKAFLITFILSFVYIICLTLLKFHAQILQWVTQKQWNWDRDYLEFMDTCKLYVKMTEEFWKTHISSLSLFQFLVCCSVILGINWCFPAASQVIMKTSACRSV